MDNCPRQIKRQFAGREFPRENGADLSAAGADETNDVCVGPGGKFNCGKVGKKGGKTFFKQRQQP